MDLDVRVRDGERLGIGVDCHELNAADALLDHAVDGVVAAASHAYDLDDGHVVAGDVCIDHGSSSLGDGLLDVSRPADGCRCAAAAGVTHVTVPYVGALALLLAHVPVPRLRCPWNLPAVGHKP